MDEPIKITDYASPTWHKVKAILIEKQKIREAYGLQLLEEGMNYRINRFSTATELLKEIRNQCLPRESDSSLHLAHSLDLCSALDESIRLIELYEQFLNEQANDDNSK